MANPLLQGSKSLVVKDNKLINAHYSMSVLEMRLFLAMVVQVHKDDRDFKTYKVRVRDLMDAGGGMSENIYHRLDVITDQLIKRYMRVPLDEGGFAKIGFVSKVEYKKRKGMVELRFDPDLKPYLLQLKEQFTIYDIRNVLSLQSSHSVRIYELLKQFERIGERTIEVERLKEMLGLIGKYRSYNYFKKRVILQAQVELQKKCDISFEFEEQKEGRRVTAIRFIIHKQKTERAGLETGLDQPEMAAALKEMGLSPTLSEEFARALPAAEIQRAIQYTRKQYEAGKIKSSVGGYLKKVLEAGGVPENLFDRESAEKKEQEKIDRDKKREEEELIKELQDRFDEVRRAEVGELLQNASEDDWLAFAAWADDHVFVKQKVFENGRLNKESEETQFWFQSFLSDRLPPKQDAFMKWTYKETGYQLRLVPGNGKDSYEVIGKQGALFGSDN